jgi:hypothetical protein
MSAMPFPMIAFFVLTALIAAWLFYRATGSLKTALTVSLAWIAVQSCIALTGFYLATKAIPPHLLLALAPPLLFIVALFCTETGRRFLDGMDLQWCVLLHSVRILVEINLFLLFLHGQVPRLLTFEGGNLDILVGLSAPLIWWAFRSKRIGNRGLAIWNSIALLGVLNAVTRALLSAPFPFQKFGFDQPTIAILTFPYILLPAFIVPAVLLTHMVTFRKLLAK